MANLPTDVANQALDAAGIDMTLGDIEEGTREAQVILRAYRNCLMQLLRAAHWDFARKTAPLLLLGDATGNTPNAGTLVATPWIYCYEYPTDCMKVRFLPWNQQTSGSGIPMGNIQLGPAPLLTNIGNDNGIGQRMRAARFVVATDYNYPPAPGQITWEVQGVSPVSRTVILSNVPSAQLVYTALILYPSVWDSLFRAALVAYLASEIALPLSKDKKFGLEMRREQIDLAKAKIIEARIADGNEGTYSTDHTPDWMRTRNSGFGRSGAWDNGQGLGVLGYGYDSLNFGDGSSY